MCPISANLQFLTYLAPKEINKLRVMKKGQNSDSHRPYQSPICSNDLAILRGGKKVFQRFDK